MIKWLLRAMYWSDLWMPLVKKIYWWFFQYGKPGENLIYYFQRLYLPPCKTTRNLQIVYDGMNGNDFTKGSLISFLIKIEILKCPHCLGRDEDHQGPNSHCSHGWWYWRR